MPTTLPGDIDRFYEKALYHRRPVHLHTYIKYTYLRIIISCSLAMTSSDDNAVYFILNIDFCRSVYYARDESMSIARCCAHAAAQYAIRHTSPTRGARTLHCDALHTHIHDEDGRSPAKLAAHNGQ